MAKILALDTSTDACSVALLNNGELTEDFRIIPRQHTRQLLPMVEKLLSEQGVSVSQLDGIAFGRGPGSFAGIRIATGAAQGLAFAADLPVLPVSTLQAIALGSMRQFSIERVASTLDARMNELYCGAYQLQDGIPVALMDEVVTAPDQLVLPEGEWFAAGKGWSYLAGMSEAVQQQVSVPEMDVYPAAGVMAELAEAALAKGEGIAAELAQPVYLRDDSAWKKKDQQKKKGQ